MKEKTVLKKWMTFFITDCKAFEEYLNKMALDGWKLKKLDVRMEFEKCETDKMKYSVRPFNNETGFVYLEEEERDAVAEKGWVFIASYNRMCVFMTKIEYVPDISQDLYTEFNLVKKQMFKYKVLPILMDIILFTFWIVIFFNRTYYDLNFFFLLGSMTILNLYLLIQFFFYIIWRIKSQNVLKNHKESLYNNTRKLEIRKAVNIFMLILNTFLCAVFLFFCIISKETFISTILLILMVGFFLVTFVTTINVKVYEY